MVSNLHTWLAIVTENELGLAFPPRNLAKKFRPDPSTLYLVIVVTNKQTDRETNTGKNIIPRFRGDNNASKHVMVPRPCLYKQEVKVIWQGPFAVHTNRANVYSEWNISFKYCQIYATGTLLTYAMTLWCHHYCLHAAVCKIHHFKLFFCINANAYLLTNCTSIFLRPIAFCRYVHFVLYMAVLIDVTVTMLFSGETTCPPTLLLPYGYLCLLN